MWPKRGPTIDVGFSARRRDRFRMTHPRLPPPHTAAARSRPTHAARPPAPPPPSLALARPPARTPASPRRPHSAGALPDGPSRMLPSWSRPHLARPLSPVAPRDTAGTPSLLGMAPRTPDPTDKSPLSPPPRESWAPGGPRPGPQGGLPGGSAGAPQEGSRADCVWSHRLSSQNELGKAFLAGSSVVESRSAARPLRGHKVL